MYMVPEGLNQNDIMKKTPCLIISPHPWQRPGFMGSSATCDTENVLTSLQTS